MKLKKIVGKYKLWKLQKKYMVNGKFPVSLDFYMALLTTFGRAPINQIKDYVDYVSSRSIPLYTNDINELRQLLTILHGTMLTNSGFNKHARLAEGKLEDVHDRFFRVYLNFHNTKDVVVQQRFLIESMELVAQCITLIETRLKNDQPVNNYYESRVLLLATDFADIYYALIIFYLET